MTENDKNLRFSELPQNIENLYQIFSIVSTTKRLNR